MSVPDWQISVQKFLKLVGHRVKPIFVRFGVFYWIVSNLVVTVSVPDFQQRSMKIQPWLTSPLDIFQTKGRNLASSQRTDNDEFQRPACGASGIAFFLLVQIVENPVQLILRIAAFSYRRIGNQKIPVPSGIQIRVGIVSDASVTDSIINQTISSFEESIGSKAGVDDLVSNCEYTVILSAKDS